MSKKVPELRFKGFTDDWEERKLSDIADRFDNLRVPITASDRKPGDTPYYGANGIQDYVEGFTHNGEFILVAEDGANDLKNYPVQYVNGKVWVNNHAHVLQGKKTITDNKFLMNAIKNFNIEPFLVGGGRAKLNADVMMKLNILLPTFVEQEKIGSLFSLLDKTIALHQRKLDLLKEQKKGYLQKMFPKNGEKVPELRFAGFADDWEERKLGDEVKINGRIGFRGYTQADIVTKETGVLAYSPTNIVNNRLYRKRSDTYITKQKYRESPEIMVKNSDILFVKTGSTLGKSALVQSINYHATVNPQIVIIRSNELDEYFLSVILTSYNILKRINTIKIGGAIPTMTETELKKFPIQVPKSTEQKKIGSFFKQLDNTIALHQRKLDLLKEQKKGFLQKMFV